MVDGHCPGELPFLVDFGVGINSSSSFSESSLKLIMAALLLSLEGGKRFVLTPFNSTTD